mmetsp:Transcript_59518/g.192535  ORF Transcript_59518/g.192535 Transcript_59518/m.192535 type:complete len:309 (+) Transcript_59518:1126-2052(+)
MGPGSRGAAEAVRAADDVDGELGREGDRHTLVHGHLMRLRDHHAVRRVEVLVVVTTVRAGNAIAWAAGDVEELLVVGVAPALFSLDRFRRDLRNAQVVNAADVAILTGDLLVVELSSNVMRSTLAFAGAVVGDRQLRQHRLQGELVLSLAREVVHEPHHGLVAVRVAHALVVFWHIGPVRLHLENGRIHGPAAVHRRVDLLQLLGGEGQQRAENAPELAHAELLAGLECVADASLEVPVELTVGRSQRACALVPGARLPSLRPLQVGLPIVGLSHDREACAQRDRLGDAHDLLQAAPAAERGRRCEGA